MPHLEHNFDINLNYYRLKIKTTSFEFMMFVVFLYFL